MSSIRKTTSAGAVRWRLPAGRDHAGIDAIAGRFGLVVVTQDWHPRGHKSFPSSHDGAVPFEAKTMFYGEQVLWPDHRGQGTPGADFHASVAHTVGLASLVTRKGTNPEIDSYSAFFENDRVTPTGLAG